MGLVAFFVLSAASLSLFCTMITSVLERSREIGLMKALGCGNRRLAAIFLAEAGVMGIAGGILGYFAGLSLAQFIGMEIFDMNVSINQPQIILADEPTGNLDKKNEEAVLDIFRELHSEGRTIVIVTHNPEIGEIGDKIIQISHGEVKY